MVGLDVSYWGAFLAGLLSFFSPCILPLVPPYLCFLGGITFEQLSSDAKDDREVANRVFITSLAFVFGFATIFVSLGATASWVGKFISEYIDIFSLVAGSIIILLGLHFVGALKVSIFFRDVRFNISNKPKGLFGGYIIGLAFAFGWTPCVGPVLAAILMVAGSEGAVIKGATLLTFYSLGIGLPFIGAALVIRPFISLMNRVRPHMRIIEMIIGILLILTGILFLTGGIQAVGFWIQEVIPSLGVVG